MVQRLGGTCIHVNESTSSAQKGETLGDTVRSMGCYCDAIGGCVSPNGRTGLGGRVGLGWSGDLGQVVFGNIT